MWSNKSPWIKTIRLPCAVKRSTPSSLLYLEEGQVQPTSVRRRKYLLELGLELLKALVCWFGSDSGFERSFCEARITGIRFENCWLLHVAPIQNIDPREVWFKKSPILHASINLLFGKSNLSAEVIWGHNWVLRLENQQDLLLAWSDAPFEPLSLMALNKLPGLQKYYSKYQSQVLDLWSGSKKMKFRPQSLQSYQSSI